MSRKFMVIKSRDYGMFSNFLCALQYLYLSKVEDRIPIIDWDLFWYSQKTPYNGSEGNVWEY